MLRRIVIARQVRLAAAFRDELLINVERLLPVLGQTIPAHSSERDRASPCRCRTPERVPCCRFLPPACRSGWPAGNSRRLTLAPASL